MSDTPAVVVASWEAPAWADAVDVDDFINHALMIGSVPSTEGDVAVELVQRDQVSATPTLTAVIRDPPSIRVGDHQLDSEQALQLARLILRAYDVVEPDNDRGFAVDAARPEGSRVDLRSPRSEIRPRPRP